jgi:hypothetical protein
MLDVPRFVFLDHRQRVEVAHQVEQFARLAVPAGFDPGDKCFQHHPVDVCLSGVHHVILHRVERVECRHLFGFAL